MKIETPQYTRSLGFFRPTDYKYETIAEGLKTITGLKIWGRWDIRTYKFMGSPWSGFTTNYAKYDEDSLKWHRDREAQPFKFIIVWSNCRPTEIKAQDGTRIVQPKPFEIVIINNANCLHRAKAMSDKRPRRRYFAVYRPND